MYKKRIVTLILVLTMLLSMMTFPASAVSASNDSMLKSQMMQILASISHEKEFYGLKNVSLNNVTIGKEIPVYVVENQGLHCSDIRIFPVIAGNQMVSMFFSTTLPSNEVYVQLGTELVPLLSPYVNTGEFAIIYDDVGVHVYTGSQIVQIGSRLVYPESTIEEDGVVTSRQEDILCLNTVDMLDARDISKIKVTSLAPAFELDVSTMPQDTRATNASLNVGIIRQPSGTRICWAITSVSIVNYILNSSLNYSTIVDQFNNGVDMSLPTSNVISLLNDHYNLNYVYSSSGTPTLTTVLNSLSRGKPVYGDFTYSGGAHAVVIRGANFNARTFSVMNPTPTTSGYTSGTVTNSNVWSFICAYSGVTMTLRYYGRYNG